jgi:hypothetical protein
MEGSVQGGRAFGTELAMENKDMLWPSFLTDARNWLVHGRTKKVLLQLYRCINVDGSWDVATIIFVIKTAVNNLV